MLCRTEKKLHTQVLGLNLSGIWEDFYSIKANTRKKKRCNLLMYVFKNTKEKFLMYNVIFLQ